MVRNMNILSSHGSANAEMQEKLENGTKKIGF
jgi:hypothetical protein